MNKIKQFFKTAFIYFVGSIMAKLISFLLLPLYTCYISPEKYGTFDLVLSLINLIGPLAFFQIWDGMFRYAFDYNDKNEKYVVINHALITFIFTIPVFIVLFLATYFYFGYQHIVYVLIYGFLFSLQYIYAYAARVFLNNRLFVFSGIANTVCSAILNIILIIGFHWDIKSLYIAPAIGCLLQIIIIELKIGLCKHFSLKYIKIYKIKEMIFFSFPLCLATISYWLLSGLTKVMINKHLGSYENGLYAVSNRFAATIAIFVMVFQYAWNELAYIMSDDETRTQKYNLFVNTIFNLVMVGSAIACLFIKIIFPYFIGKEYLEALDILPAVLIGSTINSMAGLFGTLFMTEKKTGSIMISTFIAAFMNIIVSILLIKVSMFSLQSSVVTLGISFILLMWIRLKQFSNSFKIKLSLESLISVVPLILSIIIYYMIDNTYIYILIIILMIFYLIIINKKIIFLLFEAYFDKETGKD
ncbi:lipopolysaccharide biosynthesis protein [Enterococcus faecium]|uniref:lipopolysaccharide biosynthesis protein n=1 Tax=Enterococcus TaxID=1350 RepID=UPI002019C65D|nr:oligosaccharide flippase family protein [Enterococcus faecium]NTK68303.1 oligosaccharide flippase family protein [Enterococcus faecium]UQR32315.1 oligosaccharide flippase family protein [Enterococcus faecium]